MPHIFVCYKKYNKVGSGNKIMSDDWTCSHHRMDEPEGKTDLVDCPEVNLDEAAVPSLISKISELSQSEKDII